MKPPIKSRKANTQGITGIVILIISITAIGLYTGSQPGRKPMINWQTQESIKENAASRSSGFEMAGNAAAIAGNAAGITGNAVGIAGNTAGDAVNAAGITGNAAGMDGKETAIETIEIANGAVPNVDSSSGNYGANGILLAGLSEADNKAIDEANGEPNNKENKLTGNAVKVTGI